MIQIYAGKVAFGEKWQFLQSLSTTSTNRAGVAEPRLKIWDKNLVHNLGQQFGTDGRIDRQTRPDIELLCN